MTSNGVFILVGLSPPASGAAKAVKRQSTMTLRAYDVSPPFALDPRIGTPTYFWLSCRHHAWGGGGGKGQHTQA